MSNERRRSVEGYALKSRRVDIRCCRIVVHADIEHVGAGGRSTDILDIAQTAADLNPLTVGYCLAVDRQVAAATAEVQDQQVTANAKLKPWVDAVKAAKGRTSDDLGTKYPKISEQMWKAVQSALSGSKSPKDALSSAQAAAK